MEKVIVYTMDYCPYCTQAKSLLKQRGIPFSEVLVPFSDEAQWKKLELQSGMKTMPQIYKGETLIGGYQELAELDRKDKLKSLL